MKSVSHRAIIPLLFVLLLISSVYAEKITASIGNARMIIRAKQGDIIDRCVLVKNVNTVDVDIEISATGDLADYVELKEEKFNLVAGDEKKACFTIDVKKSGTTETKINVKFIPELDSGVGLSSTVIIVAEKKDGWDFFDDEVDEETSEKKEIDNLEENDPLSGVQSKRSGNLLIISAFITTLLVIILLGLLGYSMNKKPTFDSQKLDSQKKEEKKERTKLKKESAHHA